MKIAVATKNSHKVKELERLIDIPEAQFLSLRDLGFEGEIEENGSTFEENALIKARAVCRKYGIPAISDDSGLCVDALGGAPGIYSARYADTPQARINKLLNAMNKKENRRAKFVCAMTLVSPDGEIIFQTRGECHGNIAYKQAGTNGFGYDPIFLVGNGSTTMAELSETEKNKISHRGQALRNVLEFLKDTNI